MWALVQLGKNPFLPLGVHHECPAGKALGGKLPDKNPEPKGLLHIISQRFRISNTQAISSSLCTGAGCRTTITHPTSSLDNKLQRIRQWMQHNRYHAGIGNKESWIFPHLSYYCCFRGCEAKSLSPIFVSYLSLQEIIKISLAILLRENKDTEKKKCDSPRGWHDWNQNSVFLFSSPGHWIQLLSITLLNA